VIRSALAAFALAAADEPEVKPAEVPPTSAPIEERLWLGHQIVVGAQEAPILGVIHTRTESYLLARARRVATGWELEQRACRVEIGDVAGASISMKNPVERLPVAKFLLEEKAGAFEGGYFVLWGREDVDGDGRPGATVVIDAPLCGGSMEVASRTGNFARARPSGEALAGSIRLRVEQWILGTEGSCLGIVAKDDDQRMAGNVADVPAAPGETCASLHGAPWPVRAKEPPPATVK